MKKNITLCLLILSSGVFVGYYIGVILGQQQTVLINSREKQFQIRTEEYQPSCTELQNKSRPSIVTKGSDHFLVIARKNDFIVFGLNTKENNPPMTFWWSAELKTALKQSCK